MIYIDGVKVVPKKFPDGTFALKIEPPDSDGRTRVIDWRYESEEELVLLIYITKHLQGWGYAVSLRMRYIPNARMDRVQNPEDVFTLKYFCEVINSLGFSHVSVTDPHSNVSTALLDRVSTSVITSEAIASTLELLRDKDVVLFYPDEGAAKRYSKLISLPYAFGIKNRDWKTGEIKSLEVMNGSLVKDRNVLIVDDICSRGGTFMYSAKALKECGAKEIFLYITHCEKTIFKGELIDSPLITQIYTTNSLPARPTNPKITVI